MDFPSQYERLELVFEGETKAFRARESATQRQVLLHQLSSNPRSGRQLHLLAQALRYTSTPRREGRSAILGIEEQGEFIWVVTDDAPDLLNLWEWMEAHSPKTSVPQAPRDSSARSQAVAEAQPPTPTSGDAAPTIEEKTAIFATRLGSAGALPLVDLEPPSAEEHTQIFTQHPSAPSAGEVTAIFETPPSPPAATPQPPAQPGAISGVDPSAKPGEFTMLFRRPSGATVAGDQKLRFMGYTAPAQENTKSIDASRTTLVRPARPEAEARTVQMPAPPVAPSTAVRPSGEFTAIIDEPEPATAETELRGSDFAVASNPLDGTSTPSPGEFTQIFEARPASSRVASDAAAPDEPGAFTRIFQIPVGSDLLTAEEPKTVRTVSPAASQPPAWQPGASPVVPTPPTSRAGAPAGPPPAAASSGPPGESKLPAVPQFPHVPQIPQAPKLPVGGSSSGAPKIPQFTPPKLPSAASPKIPKVPGIEKAEGLAGPSILPLVLVFGGIVLVAVLLVLFFVTRH